jgi:hypothetical protein
LKDLEELESSTLECLEFLTKNPDTFLDEYSEGKISMESMTQLLQRNAALKSEAEKQLNYIRKLSAEVYLNCDTESRGGAED